MPILNVTLVQAPGEVVASDLAQRLSDAAGTFLPAAPGALWLTLHLCPAAQYAENHVPPADCPHPAFVRVLLAQWPDLPARAALAAGLAQALAPLLQRPASRVHVLFEPPAAGRVAFGGQLR
jgi:phenylpyruvate tautomerase PptA (4-oxalocrotonate tautomerase family)